ncbi:MAG: hypothetical protein Q7J67_04450 [bacterium]|nr:hypothetical protein [bacterium]
MSKLIERVWKMEIIKIMKLSLLSILYMAVILMNPVNAQAGKNLLTNSGFEEKGKDWKKDGGRGQIYKWDDKVKESDKYSVSVTREQGAKSVARWFRFVSVKRGEEYQLSFSYKVSDKFSGEADVLVDGCRVNEESCLIRLPFPGEAISWQKQNFVFSPEKTGKICISLQNRGEGTIWYDNIVLEKAKPYEMTNLILNAGFEKATKNGLPAGGWWTYPSYIDPKKAKVYVDTKNAHSGKASVKIEVNDKQYVCFVSSPHPVNPGDTLSVSAFYRTNLRPFELDAEALKKEAQLSHPRRKGDLVKLTIGYRDVLGHSSYGGSNVKQMDMKPVTNDWEKLEGTCTVPDNVIHVEAQLVLNECLGELLFDDLVIKKINRYSLNLSPYREEVWLGENRLSLVMENYTNAREELQLELSLDGKLVDSKSFTSTGNKEETLDIGYKVETVGKHKVKVSLINKKNNDALFTGEKQISVAKVLETTLVYPTYVWPEEKIKEVTERIKVNLSAKEFKKYMLKIRVTKNSQKIKEDIIHIDKNEVAYKCPVSSFQNGDYEMEISLLDKNNKHLFSEKEIFHIMDHKKPIIKIKNGVILIDDKPFFPIGMYQGAYYDEYSKAGFNFLHRYGFEGSFDNEDNLLSDKAAMKQLDTTWKCGLFTLMSTPRVKLSKGDFEGLRTRFNALKSHPSIIGYYEEEHMIHGISSYEKIKKWHDLIREIDPHRPIAMADWYYGDKKKGFPYEFLDIAIDYWYPFPLREGQTEIVLPEWFITEVKKDKAIIWLAPQCHWGFGEPPKGAKRQRWPLPEEYKIQAYLSIIHGAKGLFYFGGHIFKEREAGNWEYLKKLVSELRDISPVFLAPTSKSKVEVTGSDKISTLLKEYQDSYYLITANRDVPIAHVTFNLPFIPVKIKVKDEDREIIPHGKSFKDTFGKYAVHVYEIKK